MITTAAMQPKLHRGFKATRKQSKKWPGRKGTYPPAAATAFQVQQQQQQQQQYSSSRHNKGIIFTHNHQNAKPRITTA